MSTADYELVIGLEVHAQLLTRSKLFSPMASIYGAEPNTQVNEICAGLPGVLPVLNEQAVDFAIRAGLALGCEIRHRSVFARKNYFYPDLPKGYQISQFEHPLCEHGALSYPLDGDERSCGITRIHLEEDAGKLVHEAGSPHSRVDLNRAGVPLIEIVGEPDLRAPDEAVAYLRELRNVLMTLGICDGNMDEGSLRCDANVSIRRHGDAALGVKVEVKNMNSFKFMKDALVYEHERQVVCLETGTPIHQETRLWDTDRRQTVTMRRKEGSDDYRYFPDPDLPPLDVDDARIERARGQLPALPSERRRRYRDQLQLPAQDAEQLSASVPLAEYFEAAVAAYGANPKGIANWAMTEVSGSVASLDDLPTFALTPSYLADLVRLIDDGQITGKIAKKVLAKVIETGASPAAVVESEGLRVVRDTGELAAIIGGILADHPEQLDELRAGKAKLRGFFVGQVMRATRGQADPQLVQQLLSEKLKS